MLYFKSHKLAESNPPNVYMLCLSLTEITQFTVIDNTISTYIILPTDILGMNLGSEETSRGRKNKNPISLTINDVYDLSKDEWHTIYRIENLKLYVKYDVLVTATNGELFRDKKVAFYVNVKKSVALFDLGISNVRTWKQHINTSSK
jgi:hypothetical protein